MSDEDREKEFKDMAEDGKEKYTDDLTDDDKEKKFKDLTDDDKVKDTKKLTGDDKEKLLKILNEDDKEKDTKNLTGDDKEKILKILNEDDKEKDITNDDRENSGNRSHNNRENDTKPKTDMGRKEDQKAKTDMGKEEDQKSKTDMGREEDQKGKVDEERERDLKVLFDLSCEISAGKGGSIPLDGVQSWFRRAGITNTYYIKEVDIGNAYRKSVKDETGITFPELKEMIATLAWGKKLDPIEILGKLSSARTPQPGEAIDYERKIGRHWN
ncbi:hypothetical protein AVEN_241530-1 [Araneus ventricosus]|uniref:Uncharacterized protein n=1 Tax=Araneus ventricosus TaxID=182803 RepID=A0A4Y2LCY0_ARAVE|nr:hypothetical protein AVEN_241530-1 [Araneus ventricosus]